MNYTALAFGLVFAAVAITSRSRAASAKDEVSAKNARLASTLFFVVAAGFFVAAAISFLGDRG